MRSPDAKPLKSTIVYMEMDKDNCEELPIVPKDKYADFPRYIVHRAGLPFHTVGVYKSYTSTYKNLMKFLYRGALFLTDFITGDANSAANRCHEKQLVLNPMFSILSVATEDFRLQTDPANMLKITAETSASLRSMIEAALNCKNEKKIETGEFYGIVDCIVTDVFHWSKTKEMRHAIKAYLKALSRNPDNRDDPQDIEHLGYAVTSAERCKLMTNKMLMLGENDSDWHHPLLVNISCNSWPPNISQDSRYQKNRWDVRDRGYS